MIIKNKIINISSLALLSVVVMLIMILASTFYNIKGVRISIIVPFLFGMFFFISKPKIRLFIKSARWILLSIFILTGYYSLSYGDNQQTLQLLLAYLIPLGVFIIAFYTGLNNRHELMSQLLKILFIIVTISLIPLVIRGLTGGIISKELASAVFSTDNSLIIFWPFLFLTTTFAFSFIYFNTSKWKMFFLPLFIVMIIAVIISSFTAALVLMILTFAGYYYIIASMKNFIKMVVTIAVAFIFVLFGLNLISTGYFGELGGSAKKINAFLMLFQTTGTYDQQDLLKTATSGRWAGYEISVKSFLSSPLFGLGYSWSINDPISSQHSSILDNFAYFGVFSITILMIYLQFIFNSFSLCKLSNHKSELQKNGVFFGILLAFFVINFVNPYFNSQIINGIIFFVGGWVSGNLSFKQAQIIKRQKFQTI